MTDSKPLNFFNSFASDAGKILNFKRKEVKMPSFIINNANEWEKGIKVFDMYFWLFMLQRKGKPIWSFKYICVT